MIYPTVPEIGKSAEIISSFGGIDKNIQISENFFSQMKNMTSVYYPMAAAREPRGATNIPAGVYAMQFCNTYGTREDISSGEITEDVFAAVYEENGEAVLKLLKKDGTEAKASYKLGGKAEGTELIAQAGYVYAFPQGVRRSTYTGENGSLSNETVTKRVKLQDTSLLGGNAYFSMMPCDAEGIEDGGASASYAATRIYDGSDSGMIRGAGELIIVKASGFSVNAYGTTVKVDKDGKVVEKYYGKAESIEIPAGGYALTGAGDPSEWLNQHCAVGTYIATSGLNVSVFTSKNNSIVYEEPETPFNGLKWYDRATSSKYVYSSAAGEWRQYTLNYILFKYTESSSAADNSQLFDVLYNGEAKTDINGNEMRSPFEGFKEGDCIKIKGFSEEQDGSYIIAAIRNGGLVLNGVIFETVTKNLSEVDTGDNSKAVIISRNVPKMDFVIEAGNRLWGCYYGVGEDGEVINEIYASALGDPTNWRKYEGISTDAWTATIGADGPFTGAIQYGGYPLFFKENTIIRVYGSAPSSFQIASYNYRGVAKGSHRSLAVCDEVLYYLSNDGVMAYNGAVPQKVSAALGKEVYKNGVAGAIGSRYFLSCEDSEGNTHLFVLDTALGAWHREDDLRVEQFLRHDTELYMLTEGKIITATGGKERVSFECETGEWGLDDPFRKYYEKFIIRTIVPTGAELYIHASYDDGEYVALNSFKRGKFNVCEVRDIPHGCDRIKLKFKGRGDVKIVSIYREISSGGDNVY